MLFLLMQLDRDRYALDIRQIAAVLPLIELQPIPGAPASVAGLIDYGGAAVPVIDLSQLLANRPAHRRFSTRIVLVHYPAGDGGDCLLGLVAEHATETVRRDPAEFQDSGILRASIPQLGSVALDAEGPLHWIDVSRLLPEPLREALCRQAVNA